MCADAGCNRHESKINMYYRMNIDKLIEIMLQYDSCDKL